MSLPLLTLDEAQARLLALVTPTPLEHGDMDSARGRYLIEPLTARRTQPAADMSAMDGYALRADDLTGPWTVTGESAAGRPCAAQVTPGHAVRISTGALIPAGAGVVVVQEDCARAGDRLTLTGTPPQPADKHIRRAGFDFAAGAELLPAGTWMGPAQIALALSAGHSHLAVHHRPRLAIIDSGDELAPRGAECAVHQIPASNGAMLAAMAAQVPCDIRRHGPVPDDLTALITAFDGTGDADIIVTSGGASVGDHDLIRPALERWGAELDFWRVAIRPGKPLLVARRGRQIVLGLPGNPVSSLVTAYLFLLPVLRAMLGAADPLPRRVMARLSEDIGPGGDRREFLRGAWDGMTVTPRHMRDSSALAAMAASNCLIERRESAAAKVAGEMVAIYPLNGGCGA